MGVELGLLTYVNSQNWVCSRTECRGEYLDL